MESLLFTGGLTTFGLGLAMTAFAWTVLRQNRRREAARVQLLSGLAFPDGAPADRGDLDVFYTAERDSPLVGARHDWPLAGARHSSPLQRDSAVDARHDSPLRSEEMGGTSSLFSEPEKSGATSRRTMALVAVAALMTVVIGTYKWFAGPTASAPPEPIASATTVSVTPAAIPDPRVELLALNHTVTPTAFLVTGRVRNPLGGAPLHDVVAVVHIVDHTGRILMTVRAPFKRAVLNAGELAEFSAAAVKATNVARYRVEFHAKERESIPQIDLRQTEPGSRSE